MTPEQRLVLALDLDEAARRRLELQNLADLELRDLAEGELSLLVERRLGAVGAVQDLDHREDEIAIESDQDPRIPFGRVEHAGNGIRLVAFQHFADPAMLDVAERKI